MEKAIALVSGIDSLSFLAQYLDNYSVEAMIIDYGQRAKKQVEYTTNILNGLEKKYSLKRRTIHADFMKVFWPDSERINKYKFPSRNYSPASILPLRNAVFMTLGIAFARGVGAKTLLTGATLDDVNNWGASNLPMYPDLRLNFSTSLSEVLYHGSLWWESPKIEIINPARKGLTKVKNLKMGFEILGEILFSTWSCFLNGECHCGICFGCSERKRAFREVGIKDITKYEYRDEI